MTTQHYPARVDSAVSDFEMESLILECYPVRRPLFIPSTKDKIGEVLSHSGVICVTAKGTFLIEFMWDNIVYVKKVPNYEPGTDFDFEDLHFVHDSHTPEVPARPVTIRRFAISMANYMQGKKFDTFTHNCHMARYYTMKKYGMKSQNPKKAKRNIFFQGFVDFFGKSAKRRAKSTERRNSINKDDPKPNSPVTDSHTTQSTED